MRNAIDAENYTIYNNVTFETIFILENFNDIIWYKSRVTSKFAQI